MEPTCFTFTVGTVDARAARPPEIGQEMTELSHRTPELRQAFDECPSCRWWAATRARQMLHWNRFAEKAGIPARLAIKATPRKTHPRRGEPPRSFVLKGLPVPAHLAADGAVQADSPRSGASEARALTATAAT